MYSTVSVYFFLKPLAVLLRLVPQRPKIICFVTFVLDKYPMVFVDADAYGKSYKQLKIMHV